MKIHPAAIVSSAAQIASDVEIGPFSVVESGVEIGSGCRLAGHVTIKEGTTLGCGTTVLEGAILGGQPQHLSVPVQPGRLVIGQRNTIREHVTVNRALREGCTTHIGDDCMLMVGAHVAHDCQVGNQVILTNNVLLAGHVEIHDRACLGGASAVHQFCRVGRLSMIGAQAKIIQDVPPFVLTDGDMGMLVGLNRIGLRRAGFDRAEVAQLKAAYQLIYRRGYSFNEMLEQLKTEFPDGPAAEFLTYFQGGNNRGFVQERRRPPRAAIRLHRSEEEKQGGESTKPKRAAG